MPIDFEKSKIGVVLLATALLAVVGVTGNYLNVQLFFSVSFIFGSVATFLALMSLGLLPALFVAAVASSYTYLMWGHPYAFVVFVSEILFVGLIHRKQPNIVYADFIFWIVIGIPLVGICYYFFIGLPSSSVLLIAIKQSINGVFNAILAQLLFLLGNLLFATGKKKAQHISAKQLVAISLMLMTILAGATPIIFDNYRMQTQQQDNVRTVMENFGLTVIAELRADHMDTSIPLDKNMLPVLLRHKQPDIGLVIQYTNGNPPFSLGPVQQTTEQGKSVALSDGLSVWHPVAEMPAMQRWRASEYFIKFPAEPTLNISSITLTHAAAPLITKFDNLRIQTLMALGILLIIALAASRVISNLLMDPIRKLATAGATMQNTGNDQNITTFPKSQIKEFDELSQILQESSDAVQSHVSKLENMQDELEERVQTRTAELEQLSMVASQTQDGVIITDIHGIIQWVNDGLLRMTSYKTSDLVGYSLANVMKSNKGKKEDLKRIAESIRSLQPFREEILNTKKTGEEIWIEMSCTPMTDNEGHKSGIIAIMTDITEKRMDRLNLIKSRIDAERSNSAKSLFLSTMSHEIRTPLNGILGMAQLLSNSSLDDNQRANQQAILNSGNTLLAIINDVLDMSKIEAGALEIEKTPFDLEDLISSTMTPFRMLAADKGLTLDVLPLPRSDKDLVADPVRIRQVLWNLTSNAIKFTTDGAICLKMSIDTENSDRPPLYDAELVISLTDTGDGIAPDRLKDIFDPFTQEDNTITRKFGGTGLGLAIVKRLIELMDGDIGIQSQVGKGTTFTVRIPFTYAAEKGSHQIQPNIPDLRLEHQKGMHVLVAEDNAVNATIARAFLEKLDCSVTVVENGELAIEAALSQKPDLIFMDIHMPVMDGVTATTELRAHADHTDTPIIGLTADAFNDSRERFEEAGMNSVLTKPFTSEQMQAVLTQYCPAKTDTTADDTPSIEPVEDLNTPLDGMSNTTPIGDDGEFESLRSVLGGDAIQPMLDIAPLSFRDHLKTIRQGLARENHTPIRESAHAIKGSAGALFAVRLAEQAAYIQENAENLDTVQSLLPIFETTLEKSIEWLKQKS